MLPVSKLPLTIRSVQIGVGVTVGVMLGCSVGVGVPGVAVGVGVAVGSGVTTKTLAVWSADPMLALLAVAVTSL